MQNQKPVKNKNQNLLFFSSRIKFKVQSTNFFEIRQREDTKGRFLARVDSMKGPTPKRTKQNQGNPKFDDL